MNRSIPLSRNYEYAVPIKAGNLRYPAHGPNVLKKKGILGKAGNYFSKEAKEELTLLVKLSTEKIDLFNLQKVYNEQKFLWTWDKETADKMKIHFQTVPEGMCRHTRAEEGKENRIKNSEKGICRRTECFDYLTVLDLLITYLKQSLTPRERHERYVELLTLFKPTNEIVLFDRDVDELKDNMFIVGGINKKTMRHLGNSNGTKLWVFELLLSENSKMEEVKNLARPLLLNGKRSTTQRNFVVKYFASDDKDTITSWWIAVNAHVKGEIDISYSNRNKELCDESSLTSNMVAKTPKFQSPPNAEVKQFAHKDFALAFGNSPEVIETKIETPLTLEQMKSFLIQTENSNTTRKFLDSYILGSTAEDGKLADMKQIAYIVDPLNKTGKVLEKYGNNTQTMVIQAITDSKLDSDLFGSFFNESIRQNEYVKMFTGFLSSFGNGATNESDGGSSLTRYFSLEKRYFLHDNGKGFSVAYIPSNDSDFDEGIMKGGATAATFEKIIMKVEKIEKSLISVVYGGKSYTSENIDKLIDSGEIQTLFAQNLIKKDLQRIFDRRFKVTNALKEQLTAKLNKGLPEEASLAALRYCFMLWKKRELLQLTNDKSLLKLLIETVEEVTKRSSSLIVCRNGLTILAKLMKVRRTSIEEMVINSASKAFISVLSTVCEANKYLDMSVLVLLDSFRLIECLLEFPTVAKSVFGAAAKLVSVAKRVMTFEFGRRQLEHDIVKEKTETLSNKLEKIKLLSKHQEQKETIDNVILLITQLEDETDKVKQFNLKEKIEKTEIPYLSYVNGELKDSKVFYSVEKECVVFKRNVGRRELVYANLKGIVAQAAKLLETELEIQIIYEDDKFLSGESGKATFINLPQTVEAYVNEVDLKTLNLFNNQSGIRNAQVAFFLEKMKNSFVTLPQPNNCKVTLSVKAQASKLFGENLVKKRPYLGNQWGKSIANGLSVGLNEFHNVINSDFK